MFIQIEYEKWLKNETQPIGSECPDIGTATVSRGYSRKEPDYAVPVIPVSSKANAEGTEAGSTDPMPIQQQGQIEKCLEDDCS